MKDKPTIADIRKAVEALEKAQIPPEPCGCIKYDGGITLTCEAHTVLLTPEMIARAKENLRRLGFTDV